MNLQGQTKERGNKTMKRLFLISLFLLFTFGSAFALIVTDNVDKDAFQYEVPYHFSTNDLATSQTAVEIPVIAGATQHNFYYVIPRDGRIVGMSIAGNKAVVAGAATFDLTINGTVTGIQTVIEPTVGTARSAVGISGSAGPQFAYIRQDRAETASARGFRSSSDKASYHNAEHFYGKATALSAGNRVGARITTSSSFAPTTTDYVITIYVLE